MKNSELLDIINSEPYDFLRQNDHLKQKIIFITLGGSYSYGTNVDGSDIDIRGCALNSANDLLGLSRFEQFLDENTDTTIYSFNKLISLICNCNPNTIELLGGKPEHYCMISYEGEQLLKNKKMFLSKRAVYSFGGYANQQLNRLENAIARDELGKEEKEEHILRSATNAMMTFHSRYSDFDKGGIELSLADSNKEEFEKELCANISLQNYPVREFNSIMEALTNVIRCYDKLNSRNTKKDFAHLNKHAMHLVRLYLMCFDILKKEEIITYREDDRDFLLSIRNGAFQNEKGTYRSEFFDLIRDYEKRLEYDKNNTSLPDHPNMKEIEDFVMEVNRKSL